MSTEKKYDNGIGMEMKIYDALKSVIDPELGINIIDLGLVYRISYEPQKGIYVRMTFSSEACPMGDIILEDVHRALQEGFPDLERNVEITMTPKWSDRFITPAGRRQLGYS